MLHGAKILLTEHRAASLSFHALIRFHFKLMLKLNLATAYHTVRSFVFIVRINQLQFKSVYLHTFWNNTG